MDSSADWAQSVRSKLSPRVSLNAYAISGNYGAIFGSSPTVDPVNTLLSPSGFLGDANIMVMMPLWTGGFLESQSGAARSLVGAAIADSAEVESDVALSVEVGFLRAQLADANVTASHAKVVSLEEIVRVTQSRFEVGKDIAASVSRVQADLSQAKRLERVALGEREKACLDLLASMGARLDLRPTIEFDSDPDSTLDPLANCLRLARQSRPAIKAARARLESTTFDLRAAHSATLPQVYGVAFADSATQTVNRGSAVGVTVSFPLYDAGERRAMISKSQAEKAKAEANMAQVQIEVERDVREAYIDVETAEAALASARDAVNAAQSAYDVINLRVANGKGILLELLDSLQALAQAKSDLAVARYERSNSLFRLRRLVGQSPASGGSK